MKKVLAFMAALCLLLGGCGTEPAPIPTEPAVTVTQPLPTQPPVTEPPVTEPPEPEILRLTLSFTGDCTLGTNQKHSYKNSFHAEYDQHGGAYFLENVRDYFLDDDLTVVNLEGSLTNSTDLQEKLWNHKGPPEYVKILTGASVEVATMGNNHRLDYGVSGFEETMQTLDEARIGYCYDDRYLICTVKGIKIGFVSVNEVYDGMDVTKWLSEGYQYLREQGCALVVACVHWGTGHQSDLDDPQLLLGCDLIDIGYDLVVGNHPHVLQAMRIYKGKFICYSLGNFCYGGSKNPEDQDSGIFRQTFTFSDGVLQPELSAQFIPCRLSSDPNRNNYQPTPATGEDFRRIIQKVNDYSAIFNFAWPETGIYETATSPSPEGEV